MSNNDNIIDNKDNEIFLFYVKDIGFQVFTFLGDLLAKTVTPEKPLSPYIASAMISNLVVNFINEFVSVEHKQQQDQKSSKEEEKLKKEMYDAILRFLYFENNKELAQEIMQHPDKALDLLKQKYQNMQPQVKKENEHK